MDKPRTSRTNSLWSLSFVGLFVLALGATLLFTPPDAYMASEATIAHPAAVSQQATVPQGRITGTVIDLTPNAPAPGVPVQINDQIVYTDGHGNYNLSLLPPGIYTIALALSPDVGTPTQEPQTIELAPDAVFEQHLFFTQTGVTGADTLPRTGNRVDPGIPCVTEVVSPGESQTIPVSPSGLAIFISPDDLDDITIFQARAIPVTDGYVPPPNPEMAFEHSEALEVFVKDGTGQVIEQQFENPIEVVFPLPPGTSAENPPVVYYFDETANTWINLPTTVAPDGTVRGFVDHITLFALS